ncbi:hypothetical protein SODALDRAFT_358100 [Sodiomyces alkalinus F11]|uniref:ATP synthase subunit g n=1 Tax=Sodiomyces alkalinus (strain CBS 110278 / VKM F-3762 / F11) TaxID=1314773 RepID=A0A3N2PYT8_SODAK|nr:hypothetical protein SODALDRAFT_358100 [Sodiomyces alkalinus F11]ROT39691.1 hypothetical protein SODALDRAFT_358100 [Sodiomyces alkalinus F11]
MSAVIARPLMRTSFRTARVSARSAARFESTSAQKATEAAKETATKASQGLSRVTSSAGPAIVGAAKGVAGALNKVGGRTGKVIRFVEKDIPFVVYYAKVALEVSKIVVRNQKMTPPSIETFQAYFQKALQSAKNPGALLASASQTASSAASRPGTAAQRLRGLDRAAILAGGVVLAECLGFFTIGEMIGRFKIVGYHGEAPAAAAHH